jgi:hypothetical protein
LGLMGGRSALTVSPVPSVATGSQIRTPDTSSHLDTNE